MQTTDLGHDRGWLDAPPAASIRRIDRELGHALQITDAGRTRQQQQVEYDKDPNNAAPPGESPHEFGNAVDSNEARHHEAMMRRHGWRRPLTREWWHWVYWADLDQHRNDPAPAPTTTVQEDTDMSMNTLRHPNGTIFFVDELGADHLGDYKTADIGLGEFLAANTRVFGAAEEVSAREFDIAVAIADRRWEAKKAEIVDAVVRALDKRDARK